MCFFRAWQLQFFPRSFYYTLLDISIEIHETIVRRVWVTGRPLDPRARGVGLINIFDTIEREVLEDIGDIVGNR